MIHSINYRMQNSYSATGLFTCSISKQNLRQHLTLNTLINISYFNFSPSESANIQHNILCAVLYIIIYSIYVWPLARVLPPVRAVLPRPWHALYPPVSLTTNVAPTVHAVDKSIRIPQVKGQVSPVPRPSQHTHKHQQAHNITARPFLEGPTEFRGRTPGTLKTILVGHQGTTWWTTDRMRLIQMGDFSTRETSRVRGIINLSNEVAIRLGPKTI